MILRNKERGIDTVKENIERRKWGKNNGQTT